MSNAVYDDLLAEKNRTILIAGAPGSGKSRLAAAAARHFGHSLFISLSEERSHFSPQVLARSFSEMVRILRAMRRDHFVVVDDLQSLVADDLSSEDLFAEFFFEVEGRREELPKILLTATIGINGRGAKMIATPAHRSDAFGILRVESGPKGVSHLLQVEKNRGASAGTYDVTEHIVEG